MLVRAHAPELALVHQWLDSWAGVGLVVVGMAHQGYQVSLGEHGTARFVFTPTDITGAALDAEVVSRVWWKREVAHSSGW
jgi:hypothetical protein